METAPSRRIEQGKPRAGFYAGMEQPVDLPQGQESRPINKLLKMAVWAGAETAVRLHIARGDDLDSRDELGLTPLMLAAARNKAAICRLLIDAGADIHAVDVKQQDALGLALASNALSAAAEIETALRQRAALVSHAHAHASPAIPLSPDIESLPASVISSEANGQLTFHWESVPADEQDEPFDLTGWQAETTVSPPVDDRRAALAQATAHAQMGSCLAIDDSPDWESVLADLPFQAARLPRAQAQEAHAAVRLLLLRALREGSVPEHALEQAAEELAGAPETDTEALLRFVVNDLGAEADERFEFRSPWETSEAFVEPQESLSEEIEVDDALEFLNNLRSSHSDPLRLYMREAQRGSLLTHEDETELARTMESASDRAIAALSGWPEALHALCSALERARNRQLSLGSIARIDHDTSDDDSESLGELGAPDAASQSSPEGDGSAAALDDPAEGSPSYALQRQTTAENAFFLADQIRGFLAAGNLLNGSSSAIENALSGLALKPSYLIRLVEEVKTLPSSHQLDFCRAVRSLRAARDRMISSNLRLVIVHARKHLYSGVPLSDLIQEGNFGLISAVDKFDWRRGFRFSTMATWWIRQSITRAVADTRLLIRLPVHVYEKVPRALSDSEAVDAFVGSRTRMDELAASTGKPRHKLEAMLRPLSSPLPIEALDDHDQRNTEAGNPTTSFASLQLSEAVRALLAELNPRVAKVIRLRFGIDTLEALTLEEVGEQFGLTRERIRQIEAKAMRLTLLKKGLTAWSPPKDEDATPPEIEITRAVPRTLDPHSKQTVSAGCERPQPVQRIENPAALLTESKGRTEKALRRANELGIPAKWEIDGNQRTAWVRIIRARNDPERRLIRLLCRIGFEFRPDQGYCL